MIFTIPTLQDTVFLMNSADYKERFVAEYWQTKIRYEKLHKMTVKYQANKLDFTPNCPLDVLLKQQSAMGQYLNTLEIRAQIESINLSMECYFTVESKPITYTKVKED